MIRLNNLHLQINDQVLLENESITINEGYVHVIRGSSGCGKTTLLYEISLLAKLSNGDYYWNDLKINALNDYERSVIRKNHIGYILQDLELISEDLNLHDNLECMFALNKHNYDQNKVAEYMQMMNLNCSLDQKVSELSRGQRQRFALVLALVKDVELIILDEPTSALDLENTIELMNYLHLLASKYHKMILIASHDQYVGENCDVLYQIEDQHLVLKKDQCKEINEQKLKDATKIDKHFYKVYRKGNRKLSKLIMNIIYTIMITVLAVLPSVLSNFLTNLELLNQMYASDEILVINTNEVLPQAKYDQVNVKFNQDQINLLREIDNVESVSNYWQLNATFENKDVTIVSKSSLDKPVIPSSLAKQVDTNLKIQAYLALENQIYDFAFTVDDYEVKDFYNDTGIKGEIIYVPVSMIDEMCLKKGIKLSSAVNVKCKNTEDIETTVIEIQRWFTNATVFSTGMNYRQQIRNLKNIEDIMVMLKVSISIGVLVIVYLIQTMENKNRELEICNLRINGIDQRAFYYLYYYENIRLILATLLLTMISYFGVCFIFGLKMGAIDLLLILLETCFYLIITRIIPLLITIRQIFVKEIAAILRSNS